MWQAPTAEATSPDELIANLGALLAPEDHWLTTLSNAAGFLYTVLDDVNWAGFYLVQGNQLFLGPFGGNPACTSIAIGKGVCGTAAMKRETIVVDDVDQFPGHIACDSGSRSEIVVPLLAPNGKVWGVLDIDSPSLSRFSGEKQLIERFAAIVCERIGARANQGLI
jgi:L-methionine (R)-S-oxide reductase